MKKKLLLLSSLLGFGSFISSAQYCAGGPSSTGDSNIESVTATGENATSISYTGCPGVAGVEDQTTQEIDLIKGQTYSVDIQFGTCGGNYGGAGEAWIDFNGDEVFDAATESIGASSGTPGSAPWDAPVTFTFTVPCTATVGVTRMRVIQEEGGSNPLDPCGSFTWGSSIDFSINVVAGISAPPIPVQDPGSPSCTTGSDLTLSGTPGTGIEWYWQGTDASGTSTADPATNPYNVTTNGTYYARAFDTNNSVWSCESSSVVVSNFALPSAPVAPVPDEDPACELSGGTNLTIAAAPSGQEYYWQGTNATGTSQTDPATAPFPVATGGTYYVAAYETATQCWSPTTAVTVNMSDFAPNEPNAVNAEISECSGSTSIILEAEATSSQTLTYTIDMFDSWGDGWNGNLVEVFADGNLIATLGGTFTAGSAAQETFTVLEGVELTTGVATGGFAATECSFDILDENNTVVGSGDNATGITPYNVPMSTYSLNWYDSAVGGTLLGTGTTFEAVGSSVMPTAVVGTYTFYIEQSNGCVSATRDSVVVTISDVNVELIGTNESCTDYADGSITIDNALCGVAPFQFSTDGGTTFVSDLTGLSAGTYDVIVQDDNGSTSVTYTVVLDTNETQIPGAPVAVDTLAYGCTGVASIELEVQSPLTTDTLFTTFDAGNGCGGGNMFDLTTNASPVTVTDVTINPSSTGAQTLTVYIKTTGGYAGSQTVAGDWSTIGSYPITTTADTPLLVSIDDFTIPANTTYGVYVEYDANYTNMTAGTAFTSADLTLETGDGLCSSFGGVNTGRAFNGVVHYTAGLDVDFEWYDTPNADNIQGINTPFEAVGTSVLPTATDGTYEFWAFSNFNGCYSEEGTLIEVNVAPVNINVEGLTVTCNGSATGSLAVTDTLCGAVPFTYSVDGGTFGVIPTDLLPGQHSVIVEDDNGDQSAEYFFIVDDTLGPQNIVMNIINPDGGEAGWNAGALETSWTVEWGPVGFTPGMGMEIGSTTVTDTFALFSGLDSDTEYDVYVSSDCGSGTANDWDGVTFYTTCAVFAAPVAENFDNTDDWVSGTGFNNVGDTLDRCWNRIPGTGNFFWGTRSGTTSAFASGPDTDVSGNGNYLFTEGSNGSNEDSAFVITPQVDLSTVIDPYITFSYHMYGADIDSLTVYASNDNGLNWDTIIKIFGEQQADNSDAWLDTSFQLSAYANDTVTFAFLNTRSGFNTDVAIDEFSVLPCIGDAGADGSRDVCRLDTLTDLNTVVTINQTLGGRWDFPLDQDLVVDDTMLNVFLLPEGTYEAYYIVPGACQEDTAVATLNVFPPSSAGQNGVTNVCLNEPINLFDGLNGNVDLGGTWYDPSNDPLPNSQPTASNIPGSYNFDYITSNGVCPADTALVEVIVNGDCDWLSIGEEELNEISVYPNPATNVINIVNPANTSALKVEIFDVNGRIVATDNNALENSTEGSIAIDHLETGIYTLRVYGENGQKTFKIVKK